ncbi:MAG TPA: sugar phosphate isomerase/epimerase [Candidatus Limnocylindrales bacterium]|nr:sugar phosphate isomerase/epimerase [Candidatus Limnocylindrales bacterium]
MTVASPPAAVVEEGLRLRRQLAIGGPLASASIGTVPILWNDVDAGPGIRRPAGTTPEAILDDIARTGYGGCQLGDGFPEGDALRGVLAARQLRLAEVYAAIPATGDGPTAGALGEVRDRLRLLVAGGGEVLCLAFDGSADRDAVAGRATAAGVPRLTSDGWRRSIDLLLQIAEETRASGARVAFHPHAATYVETRAEVERLAASISADVLPLCLDVGHWIVGGGDPVAALREYGERITHVHLKDVDADVLAELRSGSIPGLEAAVRRRLFTELGAGVLDLDGVLAALAARRYDGWLMVEQDSGWPPPAESAAIGRRVLAAALRRVSAVPRTGPITPEPRLPPP